MNDPTGAERETDRCEPLRETIRVAVEEAVPTNSARRSLELLVETSLRTAAKDRSEPETNDDRGQPQSDEVIRDVLENLRVEHPTLFKPRPSPAEGQASDFAAEPNPPVTGASEEVLLSAEGRPPDRDWLEIQSPAGAGKGERWQHLFNALRRDHLSSRYAALKARLSANSKSIFSFDITPAHVGGAMALAAALLLIAYFATSFASLPSASAPSQESRNAQAPVSEPLETGTIKAVAPATVPSATPVDPGPLRGVAQVIDTATLVIQGKVVHLHGVEWVRGGGDPDEFTRYLRGREVICDSVPAADAHRCKVEGKDLSTVVLFNGGGRATPDAPPELHAAEQRAKTSKLGVWNR